MVDVAEVEVGLEEFRIEADGALVERLRLCELVLAVVDVGDAESCQFGKQPRVVLRAGESQFVGLS